MKRLGILCLVLGEVLYWSIVMDPFLGLGIMLMILGTTVLVVDIFLKNE